MSSLFHVGCVGVCMCVYVRLVISACACVCMCMCMCGVEGRRGRRRKHAEGGGRKSHNEMFSFPFHVQGHRVIEESI